MVADHYYSVNVGAGLSPGNVTVGTSSSGQTIELRTRDGQGLRKKDVVLALQGLRAYFTITAVTP